MQCKKMKNVSKKLKLRVKKKNKRDLREAKQHYKSFYKLMLELNYFNYLTYYTCNGKVVSLNAKK